MGLSNIINGHYNELVNNHANMAKSRMAICSKCPLRKDSYLGYMCNSALWLNPETGDISYIQKDGYKHGCGCRLGAKTRDVASQCPVGKW